MKEQLDRLNSSVQEHRIKF